MSAEALAARLTYDPATGEFAWVKNGKRAGSTNASGYRQISIDGRLRYAHRLAWLMVHGTWPAFEIDHINGDKADNRIGNLRDVPKRLNAQNRDKQRNNKTGFKGVSLARRGRFHACIRVQGRTVHLGHFQSAEEAAAAYAQGAELLHPLRKTGRAPARVYQLPTR